MSGPATPLGGTSPRALLITADEVLLDDLVRLAAAAGTVVDVANDVGSGRRNWSHAPLVFVGADLVNAVASVAPPRRRDVYVVGRAIEGDGLWQLAVRIGADEVLELPESESRLVERLADAAEGGCRDARTIGVIGGRGGAGATTLAVALANAGVRTDLATLLVDNDPLGGGVDLVLGGEETPGMRWPDLAATRGRVGAVALRDALPHRDGVRFLSWDRGTTRSQPAQVTSEAMQAVLGAACRGHELVVIDLPRHLDEAVEETLARCVTTLLVVPAQVRAVAAAGRVAATLTPLTPDLRVVVRGPAPARLDAQLVAEALGLALAGELTPEPGLERMLEAGEVPGQRRKGPLASFSETFVGTVTEQAAA